MLQPRFHRFQYIDACSNSVTQSEKSGSSEMTLVECIIWFYWYVVGYSLRHTSKLLLDPML